MFLESAKAAAVAGQRVRVAFRRSAMVGNPSTAMSKSASANMVRKTRKDHSTGRRAFEDFSILHDDEEIYGI